MKPYYQDSAVTIYHGDCREIVPAIGNFDLLLTDPPYGINADKKKAHSSIRDNDNWENKNWDNFRPAKEVFSLIKNSTKNQIIWGGNYFADLLPASAAWLSWRKPEAESGFSLADIELAWTSGKFSAREKSFPRRDGNQHPTQKPIGLMIWCLQFFPEAKTILDPFAGSGTTGRAAKDLRRKATLIEMEEKYCEIAAKRMEQEVFAL